MRWFEGKGTSKEAKRAACHMSLLALPYPWAWISGKVF